MNALELRAKWERVTAIKRAGRDLYKRVQTTPPGEVSAADREAFNTMVAELKAIDASATHLEPI